MQCPRSMTTALGRWSGTSTLFKSWLPAPENVDSGPTTLTLALGPKSAWLEVRMDWMESGQPQHGEGKDSGPNRIPAPHRFM